MSQTIFSDINPASTSGNQLATYLNEFKDAVASGFTGVARPSNLQAGGYWLDTTTTAWLFKIYDGVADITIFSVDTVTDTPSITGANGTFTITKTSVDTVSPIVSMVKARTANNGQVLIGDVIGTLQAKGNASDLSVPITARIKAIATQNFTGTDAGTDLVFEATPSGSATIAEFMRIKNSQLGLGNTAPENTIHARGTGIRSERKIDDALPAKFILRKKKLTGTGQTLSADVIGTIESNSTDETGAEVLAVKIEISATENHSTTAHGSSLSISSKKIGSVSFVERLAIGETIAIKDHTTLTNTISLAEQVDSTTTGAAQSLTPTKSVYKVTHASLTSINNIANPIDGKLIVLINGVGASIVVTNDSGGTAANRIITGTGEDLTVADKASLLIAYDTNSSRWRVIGGSGSGGSSNTITDSLTLADTNTIVPNTLRGVQTFRVQGTSAAITLSTTPFGASPPADGGVIYLIGNSDTNTVTISQNDASNGCLMDGDVTLAKGQTVGFMYSSSLARYVRL